MDGLIDTLETRIRKMMAEALEIPMESVDLDARLDDYGLESIEQELMLDAPEFFGNLNVWKLPRPITGRDLVRYAEFNSRCGAAPVKRDLPLPASRVAPEADPLPVPSGRERSDDGARRDSDVR